jgi:hypothetical protein
MRSEPASGPPSQDLFRSANERLFVAVRDRVDPDRPIPFLCECSDRFCRSTIPLTVRQFVELRRSPGRFAKVAGHPPSGEREIELEGEVRIVESPRVGFLR